MFWGSPIARSIRGALLLTLALAPEGGAQSGAPTRNGFVLDPSSVATDEILRGGPPRDGIAALDHPETASYADAGWGDDQLILGLSWNGEARAYPIAILDWHEVVNDTVGRRPVLISYCPLCGTGMVFDRRVNGEARRFGVSGLLFRSDLLLFDRETESLWSQISSEAVTGPSRGQRLRLLRSTMASLKEWRRDHPETTVLTRNTGHSRPYGRTPYGDYARNERLLFPAPRDPRYHPKMPTLGLRVPGGPARAYPAQEVAHAGGRVEELFAGELVVVRFDSSSGGFRVEAPDRLDAIEGYWFAWMAFHPESSVFVSSPTGRTGSATEGGASKEERTP